MQELKDAFTVRFDSAVEAFVFFDIQGDWAVTQAEVQNMIKRLMVPLSKPDIEIIRTPSPTMSPVVTIESAPKSFFEKFSIVEEVLFVVALFVGCIGAMACMYFFVYRNSRYRRNEDAIK